MSSKASSRYTSVAIALHWAIAAAILFLIWLGWNMEDNQVRYQLHKSLGITVLLLTVARVAWRMLNPPPPLSDEMAGWEKTLSHAVHLGFYGLMIALPLTGWLYASTSYDFDVPTVLFGVVSWPDIPGVGFLSNEAGHNAVGFLHGRLAWLMLILLALHVGGALKHEFSAEDGVLKRIIPGLFGKTGAPVAPQTGFMVAFGSAFALFAVITGSPLVAGAFTSGGFADLGGTSTVSANWSVDMEASSIAFSGIHDGNKYSGEFNDWRADIAFDPANLSGSSASVSVATNSAVATQKLYTDSLKSAEWLDPNGFPVATVDLANFTETADGYTSEATLTLKGMTVTVPFDFTLDIAGDQATMTGSTVLLRTPLDLGQQSDAGADWVDEEIRVDVRVEASRIP